MDMAKSNQQVVLTAQQSINKSLLEQSAIYAGLLSDISRQQSSQLSQPSQIWQLPVPDSVNIVAAAD